TMPIRWRAWLMSVRGSSMLMPSTTTLPEDGSSSRLRHRSRVDLPEPDGPITNTSSGSATLRSTPLRTWRAPKCLWRPRASTIGHELWIFRRGVHDGGVTAEGRVGAAREDRLGGVGLRVVDLHREAVLGALGLGQGLVGRALVDGDGLALEVRPILDRLRALLDAALVCGPQVARGEQHVLR